MEGNLLHLYNWKLFGFILYKDAFAAKLHNVFIYYLHRFQHAPAGVSRSHSNKNSFRARRVGISSCVHRQIVFTFGLWPILSAEGTITSCDNSIFE